MILNLKAACISFLLFMFTLAENTCFSQTMEYEMLVSSRNTHSVKRFNGMTGDYIDDFIVAGSGGLNTTQHLIQQQNGNILVSGRGNTVVFNVQRRDWRLYRAFHKRIYTG